MKKAIVLICFGFILPLLLKAQDNEQVTMRMLSLKNALLSKDSVSLSSLLTDDVTYGHSNGIIQTKSQLIRDVMSGAQDYKSIEPSDVHTRMYDNTGIVTLKLKVNLIYGGKEMNLNMFATFTWVKINNEWKLVARQSVKLPDA